MLSKVEYNLVLETDKFLEYTYGYSYFEDKVYILRENTLFSLDLKDKELTKEGNVTEDSLLKVSLFYAFFASQGEISVYSLPTLTKIGFIKRESAFSIKYSDDCVLEGNLTGSGLVKLSDSYIGKKIERGAAVNKLIGSVLPGILVFDGSSLKMLLTDWLNKLSLDRIEQLKIADFLVKVYNLQSSPYFTGVIQHICKQCTENSSFTAVKQLVDSIELDKISISSEILKLNQNKRVFHLNLTDSSSVITFLNEFFNVFLKKRSKKGNSVEEQQKLDNFVFRALVFLYKQTNKAAIRQNIKHLIKNCSNSLEFAEEVLVENNLRNERIYLLYYQKQYSDCLSAISEEKIDSQSAKKYVELYLKVLKKMDLPLEKTVFYLKYACKTDYSLTIEFVKQNHLKLSQNHLRDLFEGQTDLSAMVGLAELSLSPSELIWFYKQNIAVYEDKLTDLLVNAAEIKEEHVSWVKKDSFYYFLLCYRRKEFVKCLGITDIITSKFGFIKDKLTDTNFSYQLATWLSASNNNECLVELVSSRTNDLEFCLKTIENGILDTIPLDLLSEACMTLLFNAEKAKKQVKMQKHLSNCSLKHNSQTGILIE